jgi:hypothetical protein
LVAVLEGLPADVEVTSKEIADQLARRRLGYGRGARMKFEQDVVTLLGGVRHGRTIGAPIAVQIGNTEWPKWEQIMASDPADPDILANLARNAPLTRPRPGHADLAGMQKYGFDDARPVLERASARETAARVALGTIAAHFLRQVAGAEIVSHVVAIGAVCYILGLVGLAYIDVPWLLHLNSALLLGGALGGTSFGIILAVIGRTVGIVRVDEDAQGRLEVETASRSRRRIDLRCTRQRVAPQLERPRMQQACVGTCLAIRRSRGISRRWRRYLLEKESGSVGRDYCQSGGLGYTVLTTGVIGLTGFCSHDACYAPESWGCS